MFNFFYCEEDFLIAGIVGGLTALIAIAMIVLSLTTFKNNRAGALIATIASFVSAFVATLFCYNLIVIPGYILSVVATAVSLSRLASIYHCNTIYANMSMMHRFAKFIIPVSFFFAMFRPIFIDCGTKKGDVPYYSWLSAIGLRCKEVQVNKWTGRTSIVKQGVNPYSVDLEAMFSEDFNIVAAITLLLFVVVLAMQVLLVLRQFADPDNARDWADAGILVSCIGAMFIYGMFTSNNFKVTSASVENTAANLYVLVALGALNRLLYFEKVENLLDKMLKRSAK